MDSPLDTHCPFRWCCTLPRAKRRFLLLSYLISAIGGIAATSMREGKLITGKTLYLIRASDALPSQLSPVLYPSVSQTSQKIPKDDDQRTLRPCFANFAQLFAKKRSDKRISYASLVFRCRSKAVKYSTFPGITGRNLSMDAISIVICASGSGTKHLKSTRRML